MNSNDQWMTSSKSSRKAVIWLSEGKSEIGFDLPKHLLQCLTKIRLQSAIYYERACEFDEINFRNDPVVCLAGGIGKLASQEKTPGGRGLGVDAMHQNFGQAQTSFPRKSFLYT